MKIETERCVVRPFEQRDLDAFMIYRNDLEWMKYQGFKGLARTEYEEALLGPQALDNGVQLAVVCRRSNALLGDLYVKQEGDTYWIGYTIAPENARKGYASEAVQALISFLAAKGAGDILAGARNGNSASEALLRKLGFSFQGEADGEQIFRLDLARKEREI